MACPHCILGMFKSPQGRQHLKQMIEEAEKKAAIPRRSELDQAIVDLTQEIMVDHPTMTLRRTALETRKDAIKAAAQREYGKVLGVKDENITASITNDRVYVWKNGWLNLDGRAEDIPGILYALSTLPGSK